MKENEPRKNKIERMSWPDFNYHHGSKEYYIKACRNIISSLEDNEEVLVSYIRDEIEAMHAAIQKK